jgi:hypothetical protein
MFILLFNWVNDFNRDKGKLRMAMLNLFPSQHLSDTIIYVESESKEKQEIEKLK